MSGHTASSWPEARQRLLAEYAGGQRFMQGDVAVAIGALYAGCDFFGAYPITPASEIAETMSNMLPRVGGKFVQFEDELASISAIIGAAWAGSRSMTATSGPGFSLMQENLGYAVMTETPTVIVDVQRSGPSTGQATLPAQGDFYQARWGTHGDHEAIALSPWSAQESFELAIEAFNLAERFRQPVLLMTDGETGHSRERVAFPDPADVTIVPREFADDASQAFGGATVPKMVRFGEGTSVHVTGSTHVANGLRQATQPPVHDALIRRVTGKISDAREELTRLDTLLDGGEKVVVISHGISARPAYGAVQALRAAGHPVGLIRVIGLWPFPGPRLAELCQGADAVVVPEMNLGQMNREIERYLDCPVVGLNKIGGHVFHQSEIANEALAALGRSA
jgi:2-oxoglutarate/2-oxoacid ferredoxin oxidoreductase subunit alpha